MTGLGNTEAFGLRLAGRGEWVFTADTSALTIGVPYAVCAALGGPADPPVQDTNLKVYVTPVIGAKPPAVRLENPYHQPSYSSTAARD